MFSKSFTAICLISLCFALEATNQQHLDFLQLEQDSSANPVNDLLADSATLFNDATQIAGAALLGSIAPTIQITEEVGNLGVQAATIGTKEFNDALDLATKYQKNFNNELLNLVTLSQQTFNNLLDSLKNPLDPNTLTNLQNALNTFLTSSGTELANIGTLLQNLVADSLAEGQTVFNDANTLIGSSSQIVGDVVAGTTQAFNGLAPAAQQLTQDTIAVGTDLNNIVVGGVGQLGQLAGAVVGQLTGQQAPPSGF